MTPLQEKLISLDTALTEKTQRETEQTGRNQNASAETLYMNTYYLSDGGYSRVGYDMSTERVFLDSLSLPKVRENWAKCTDLIREVEEEIEKEWCQPPTGRHHASDHDSSHDSQPGRRHRP
jgi:hypothetical protein